MTTASPKATRQILFIAAIAVTIFIGGTIALHLITSPARDKIASGLLADFVITFPTLYYFVIVRPLKVSAKSVLIVLSICCLIAYLVLPPQQWGYILQIRKLSALAEVAFIVYAVTKINKIRAAYKIHQLNFADPVFNLRSAMKDVMGDTLFIKVLASELAVLRYGLLFWKKEKAGQDESISFTTHKESGYIAIWCILLVAVMVEIFAFHLLLMRWSNTAALIVTVLSIYGTVFLIADLSAILKRRILINGNQLVLRTGLRWRIVTGLDNVSSVTKIKNDYQSDEPFFKGGVLKSSSNLLITFTEPVTVDKLYGSVKEFKSVLMSIDDFEKFENHLADFNKN